MSGGQYRLEISTTARAGCQGTECKKEGIKIQKGQLRLGTFVTIQEHQSWRWKHWGCVTPKQLNNINASIEGDYEYLDGFEDLDDVDQARVRKALEEGHVADDDWTGDPEMNRPGMNGYRTPASKKKMKEEKKEREAAKDSVSPTKPESKKRGRVKQEINGEHADEGEPARKKVKSASRKGGKVKLEADDDDGSDENVQPKGKGRKEVSKVKTELDDADIGARSQSKPKSRKAASKVKTEAADEAVPSSEPTKIARAPRKAAAKKIKYEDSDAEGSAGETGNTIKTEVNEEAVENGARHESGAEPANDAPQRRGKKGGDKASRATAKSEGRVTKQASKVKVTASNDAMEKPKRTSGRKPRKTSS